MIPISIQPAIFSTGALGPGLDSDVIHMIVNAGLMVKFVMLVLLVFSVVSWAIIFMKWRLYRRARDESEQFLERFWEGTEFSRLLNESVGLGESPLAQLFRAGFTEFRRVSSMNYPPSEQGDAYIQPVLAQVERALKRTAIQQGKPFGKVHIISCYHREHSAFYWSFRHGVGYNGVISRNWS